MVLESERYKSLETQPKTIGRMSTLRVNLFKYRVVPGDRNWLIETAAWIWSSFLLCALETRWLGVRKTCGIGLFYRNYRSLLEETGWLGCWLHQCVLRNTLAGSKKVVSISRNNTVINIYNTPSPASSRAPRSRYQC